MSTILPPLPIPAPMSTTVDLDTILQDRSRTHGNFFYNAAFTAKARALLRGTPGWSSMPVEHQLALDEIMLKIGRITSTSVTSMVAEHWDDIGGYSVIGGNRARKGSDV